MRQNWDHKKTTKQNIESLGLATNVNDLAKKDSVTNQVVQLFDVPKSDSLKPKREKLPLNEDEQKYIAKCLAKHGDNYKKMAFDLKVNKMQNTEHILRKMGSRFLLLEDHQRVGGVEVPDKVRHLVLESS